MPSARAGACARSMTRPWAEGAGALMRNETERPVFSLTTRTLVPNGRLLCAAVMACVLKRSPLAVLRPWNPGPYQDAAPRWRGLAEAAVGVKKAHERRAAASGSLSIFIDPHPLWFVEAVLIRPIRARMGH